MATPVKPRNESDGPRMLGPLWRVVWMAALALLVVFLAGVLVGIGMRIFEEGAISTRGAVFAVLAAAVIAGSLWFIARLRRATRDEPVPSSVRKSNRLNGLSIILGMALGLFMVLGSALTGTEFDLYSNAPISPTIVAIVIAIWLVTLPMLTLRFYRAIDEHALQAYNFGALVALHLFFFAAPVWWFGWRGGFLPEPEMMLLYLAVLLVWCIAWTWRRYR